MQETISTPLHHYLLCRRKWRGRRRSSGCGGRTGIGTCGSASRLVEFPAESQLERHGWFASITYLDNLYTFIIDLGIGGCEEREKEERHDKHENSIPGGRVGKPVDHSDGGPSGDHADDGKIQLAGHEP